MGGDSHLAGWMVVLATLPCCVMSEESSGRRGFPEPQVLAQTATDADHLVLDKGELFWADAEGVKQARPGGAAVTRSQQTDPVKIRGLAVVGDTIYWAQDSNWSDQALVLKASRSGGDQTVIYKGPGMAYALAANESGVFFLHAGWMPSGDDPPIAKAMGVLADGTVRQYTAELADASGLAVDATTVYISSGGPVLPGVETSPPGRIDACPMAGCESGPVNLASGLQLAPRRLKVHGGFVYGILWRVSRVPISGGQWQDVGMTSCWEFAVDELGFYCAGQGRGANEGGVIQHLWEAGRDTLLTPTTGSSVAIDRESVYWTAGIGQVLKLERWSGVVPSGWTSAGAPGGPTTRGADAGAHPEPQCAGLPRTERLNRWPSGGRS